VAVDTQSIIRLLKADHFDYGKINAFINKNYQFLDGGSAERIYLQIFKSTEKTG
jgi:hypothetical protein